MNRTNPPPATCLVTLAGDLLAQRARELLEQVAFGSWAPGIKLRDALATYAEVRTGNIVKGAVSPLLADCADPAPETRRSQVRT